MMTMMSDGYDEDLIIYVFHIRFKSPVRPDWRCRGCVVIIIMMTVGAHHRRGCTMMVIIDDDDRDDDDDERRL